MQLLQLGGDQTQTMTSKEIAELTGKNHADVLRDIRNLQEQVGTESIFALSEYKDSTGRTLPMYSLDKKQTLLLISGYNALLRLKIINRWEELEKPKELSRLEILTLALEAEKKVIELQEKIEVDKPKVEFAEQLLSATNSLDFGTSCKAMNLPFGRNKMFEICRKLNFIMHNNQPYQTYIDQGYFTLLETSYVNAKSGDRVLTTKTMVTAKGQNWLINNFKKNGLM
jgi:phage antirepressor YoqD-like protein